MTKEKIKDKSLIGKRNRRAGHNAEREVMHKFRNIGFVDCTTSRYESKSQDDKKVDLCNTDPLNVQIKCSVNNVAYDKILEEMPKDSNYNIVIHKKRNTSKFYVVLEDKDFFNIIINNNSNIDNKNIINKLNEILNEYGKINI